MKARQCIRTTCNGGGAIVLCNDNYNAITIPCGNVANMAQDITGIACGLLVHLALCLDATLQFMKSLASSLLMEVIMSLLVLAADLVQEVSPSKYAQKLQYGTFNLNREYCIERCINLQLCAIAFD